MAAKVVGLLASTGTYVGGSFRRKATEPLLRPVNLRHVLRQIQPDGYSAPPPWHSDAVGGATPSVTLCPGTVRALLPAVLGQLVQVLTASGIEKRPARVEAENEKRKQR
jgi:hypothetical protein